MVKVNIWKHFLGDIYVEVDNYPYGSHIVRVYLKENTREVSNVGDLRSAGFLGEEFFDDCIFVTKTTIPNQKDQGYCTENVVWRSLKKLYGITPVIPKKIPRTTTEKPYPLDNLRFSHH